MPHAMLLFQNWRCIRKRIARKMLQLATTSFAWFLATLLCFEIGIQAKDGKRRK
jgi:hypothetical protein